MKRVIIIVLIIIFGCVSVRVQTGEGNAYEGATKSTKGIETNLNDSIP